MNLGELKERALGKESVPFGEKFMGLGNT